MVGGAQVNVLDFYFYSVAFPFCKRARWRCLAAGEQFLCLPTTPVLQAKELATRAAASLWQRCRGQLARKEILCCNAGSLAPCDTEIEVAAEVGAAIKRMERPGDLLAE